MKKEVLYSWYPGFWAVDTIINKYVTSIHYLVTVKTRLTRCVTCIVTATRIDVLCHVQRGSNVNPTELCPDWPLTVPRLDLGITRQKNSHPLKVFI